MESMMAKMLRAAVVGASTLLGKEVAEALHASGAAWDLTLLDAGEGGQVVAAGDEAMVIVPVESTSFAGMDVVLFAGDAGTTRQYWGDAQKAGASVVDVSGALENEAGALLGGVLGGLGFGGGAKLDLATSVVVAAHPAAVMLAMVVSRLAKFGAKVAATVMEPASEMGTAGVDELQQQTVALLTFQTVPQDVYDAQVAFALRDELGGAAKGNLLTTATTVRRHLGMLAEGGERVALQWVQAPVFHGYTASVRLEIAGGVEARDVVQALEGDGVRVVQDEVSNQSAVGQDDVLVRVSADAAGGFWLWMAADNLRLAALTAVACAGELAGMRPAGAVQ